MPLMMHEEEEEHAGATTTKKQYLTTIASGYRDDSHTCPSYEAVSGGNGYFSK